MKNKNLSFARRQAHYYFDQLWSGKNAVMSRHEAYQWMFHVLCENSKDSHISHLSEDRCYLLISEVKRFFKNQTIIIDGQIFEIDKNQILIYIDS